MAGKTVFRSWRLGGPIQRLHPYAGADIQVLSLAASNTTWASTFGQGSPASIAD
jgi:hypothetical protein